MTAVVRVKRRINEVPLGAFVLNGKRRRLLSADEEEDNGNEANKEVSTVLKFAGTMQTQDHNAVSQLVRSKKEAQKHAVRTKSRKPTNLTERSRQEMRASMQENRFRVVNCFRTTVPAAEEENAADAASTSEQGAAALPAADNTAKELTIVDVVNQADMPANASSNALATVPANQDYAEQLQQQFAAPTEAEEGFVYDLYYPENEHEAAYVDLVNDDYLRVLAYNEEHNYDAYAEEDADSEDSNAEDYYANDYPDSDEGDEGDKLCKAIKNFVLDDSDDDEYLSDKSSSDDDNDGYVTHSKHEFADAEDFFDEQLYDDVERYGEAYALYKKRNVYEQDDSETEEEEDIEQKSTAVNDILKNLRKADKQEKPKKDLKAVQEEEEFHSANED